MTTELCDYRVDIDDKLLKADCYFPGVTYDDFDRAGNIAPWKVCRMFEAGRAIPFHKGNFLDFAKLYSQNETTYFVLGGDYYFNPCLWEMTRRQQYFPYKITTQLIGIGQTSLTIRSILINLLDNKEVASYNGIIVYIDVSSKRPKELPSWHRQKFQNVQSSERVRINSSVPKVPENAYSTKLVVAASDTDHNGHTNQASYIRFCLDTAESARRSNLLHCFTGDICLYPIIKLSVGYLKETLSGDELITYMWENDTNPSILHFVINCGETVVFVSTVTFRETPCSKL